MADFGGTIIFRAQSANLSVRGSVSHNPGRFSYEGMANHDGTVDRSAKPEGYRFAMELSNRDSEGNPVNVEALMAQSGVTFTFIHDTEGVTRTYSGASLTGDPSVDDMTGAISGITGIAQGLLEVKR